MARKTYTAEQIIGMLREADVRLSQGEKVGAICRGLSISEQSHYRWRLIHLLPVPRGSNGAFRAAGPSAGHIDQVNLAIRNVTDSTQVYDPQSCQSLVRESS